MLTRVRHALTPIGSRLALIEALASSSERFRLPLAQPLTLLGKLLALLRDVLALRRDPLAFPSHPNALGHLGPWRPGLAVLNYALGLISVRPHDFTDSTQAYSELADRPRRLLASREACLRPPPPARNAPGIPCVAAAPNGWLRGPVAVEATASQLAALGPDGLTLTAQTAPLMGWVSGPGSPGAGA